MDDDPEMMDASEIEVDERRSWDRKS